MADPPPTSPAEGAPQAEWEVKESSHVPVAEQPWLSAGVVGIGAASFLADVGHEVPTALLPSLLISLGAPAAILGAIEGVADALAGMARLAGGAMSDDPARRRALAVGGDSSNPGLSGLLWACTSGWQGGRARGGALARRGQPVPPPKP